MTAFSSKIPDDATVNAIQPSLSVEDKMKNPVLFLRATSQVAACGGAFDLYKWCESIWKNMKEELLEFVDSYEDRIHCLKQFEDQLSTIMNEIIIDYSKENIYACSFFMVLI